MGVSVILRCVASKNCSFLIFSLKYQVLFLLHCSLFIKQHLFSFDYLSASLISLSLFLSMIKLIFFLLCLWEVLCASTSPLSSNFGEAFRSGEVTISLIGQESYDISAPLSTALSPGTVSLVLSMKDYYQSLDSIKRISYQLIENSPSSSTNTLAVFRLILGFPSLTSLANVKYLTYLTSILSDNFQILVEHITPGTLSDYASYYDH